MDFSQVNSFKYSKRLNNSILAIDGTLTGTKIPDQRGSWNNGNEEVLYILQKSRTRVSSSYGFVTYPCHSLGCFLPLCRDSVSAFYSRNRHGDQLVSGISQVKNKKKKKKTNKKTLDGNYTRILQGVQRFLFLLSNTNKSI